MPLSASEVGLRHRRAAAGGALRAAVFGVNDGLVSNTSLILGVAGASSTTSVILMSGIAGMLAGSFSMAAGEYISMRSQRDLFEYQIGEERQELERYPEEEAEELALIYSARGVPIETARELSHAMLKDPEQMLDTLAREELGLNPDDLGSPWGAAISSFTSFAFGACVPLLPFLFEHEGPKIEIACALSAIGLFAIGSTLSLFSGKNALIGGVRMMALGAAAGAATFAIGRAIGVAVS
jgi:VIT1/CCC1 family predicted Fe2+/Mn2+ transporter